MFIIEEVENYSGGVIYNVPMGILIHRSHFFLRAFNRSQVFCLSWKTFHLTSEKASSVHDKQLLLRLLCPAGAAAAQKKRRGAEEERLACQVKGGSRERTYCRILYLGLCQINT